MKKVIHGFRRDLWVPGDIARTAASSRAAQVTPATLRPLPVRFYAPGARVVAPKLLGHYLLRRTEDGWSGGMIVETEAYLANDPACHGFRGKTSRNAAMFGPAGRAYVYFIYGNHWCFNAVCHREGVAEAVLIRAIAVEFGIEWMQARRPVGNLRELTNGPAKLCAALDIDRNLDGVSLCETDSMVFIARNPKRARDVAILGPVMATARIGITQAAEWPLRFCLAASEFVSRRVK